MFSKSKFIQLIALVSFAILASAAQADTTWRISAAYAPSSSYTEVDEWLAEQIEEATDGDLEIRVYPNGSLVKHPDIVKAVSTGQVQMGDMLASILSNENPVFGLDSIPFLATSHEQALELWEAQRPQVEQYLEDRGIILLYTSPWPAQGLYTNKEINHVSDMEGLKMRTYNKMGQRTAELLEATPTQVEVPELPQAFSTGMVNAMFASPATGRNTQAWDYAEYFYDVKAWIPKNLVIMNKEAFDELPDAQQDAVMEAADRARERSWSIVQDILERDVRE